MGVKERPQLRFGAVSEFVRDSGTLMRSAVSIMS